MGTIGNNSRMKRTSKLTAAENAQRIFRVYRLVVSAVLLLTYFISLDTPVMEITAPAVFLISNSVWFILVLFSSLSILLSRRDYLGITLVNSLIDFIALASLAYATGGINGGLMLLMLPQAAMTGLMLPRRLALLAAAIGSLSILFVQTLLLFESQSNAAGFLPTGLLGLVLFATTLVFGLLGSTLESARKREEASKRQADAMRSMNESIIARMEIGVLVVAEDIILLANRAARNLLVGTQGEHQSLEGSNIRDLTRLGHRYEDWLKHKTRDSENFTHPYTGEDIRVQFAPVRHSDSEQILVFLEDSRRVRQRAQQLKLDSLSHLSAGLAHEVRNPLSAISQASQLLQQSEQISDEDRTFADIIDRHCIRMNQIIDVVQQMSRRIEPDAREIALKPLLEELIREINESRSEPSLIDLAVPDDCLVRFDPANLKQVVGNIVENGLRFSQQATGTASVRLSLGSNPEDQGYFLDIHDSGPGIPRDRVRLIFDPFFTTGSGGSGLGLYVAKDLCEVNFATLHYVYPKKHSDNGFFRLNFRPNEN